MLEKDEIETADKILTVDIKMTDSKNLLDSKTFLFWSESLTSFAIKHIFSQKF